ncbi:hypothetical protein [uncultured Photobacterium sp.]|uniref:hypothetical protein n=1 Tax=uncultured Photobacterium sp. TaxID=173973 RepID=UPI002626A339|nr:hypothetical protein [uncultured Photobacterium sp.]
MRTAFFLLAIVLTAFQANAALELKDEYGAWSHYESQDVTTGEPVIIGVSDAKSDGNVETVALRCTYEGVNLLFFKSLKREENGYQAKSHIDNGDTFDMDVWVKGSTHWATIPEKQIESAIKGKQLSVTLEGISGKEVVTVPLNGFGKMYQALIPTCKE